MNASEKSTLFNASCMALVVTSMTFALRAGLLKPLGEQFHLSDTELGWITGMAFFGFPVATALGGFFVDALGMKRFMWLAFAAHFLGLTLTIFADGFWTLFISTFLVGFANGTVEAVCNPLVASMYTENKTAMLNKFHVWFPGGIVIGSLVATAMNALQIGWQWQVATMYIPLFLYAYLFWGKTFPKTERVTSGVTSGEMFAAVLSPLWLFMAVCMFLTANTELSTTQWVEKLLGAAGANPLLVLALVTGIMAVGRYFGEPIIHRFSPAGVLLGSSVLATLGIWWLSSATGGAVYAAAVVFALGVCYFWPTMLGFTSENIPKSGALGMSLMGGVGMFGNWAYQSFFIGPKLDSEKVAAAAKGITDQHLADLSAGQHVLSSIAILPMILMVLFTALYFYMRKK
jgi:MFS family permease